MLKNRISLSAPLSWIAAPGHAATVTPFVQWHATNSTQTPKYVIEPETLSQIFYDRSFGVDFSVGHVSVAFAVLQIAVVVALAAWTARSLPHARYFTEVHDYSAAAFPAISRILATIARKPFERCDDRWSCNPRRPSSVPASTLSTSRTVRPL